MRYVSIWRRWGSSSEVTVVSELGGNLILNVKESRVALDKTMAMRIMV